MNRVELLAALLRLEPDHPVRWLLSDDEVAEIAKINTRQMNRQYCG